MNKIHFFLKKNLYRIKGKSKKLPPYFYDSLCERISNIENIESLCFREHILSKNTAKKRVLIRHDVDHDIETALEMAKIESKYGLRSTYFILHTADYFLHSLESTIKICKDIQEMGHEIGIHNDLISDYFEKKINPKDNLERILKIFHENNIEIKGSASHGSKLINSLIKNCLSPNMIEYRNYLIFKEIYSKELMVHKHKIPPPNPWVDNSKLELSSIKMSSYGLEYEAYFIPYNKEKYVSDSGGIFWKYGSCPVQTVEKSTLGDNIQFLFHPIWWKKFLK